MFKNPKAVLLALGIPCLAITLFGGTLFVPLREWAAPFAYTMGGLLLSEALLFLSLAEIAGNPGDRAIPFRFANIAVSALYILFAFAMIIPYACGCSPAAICLAHLIGLFIALALHVLLCLAHQSALAQDAADARSRIDIKKMPSGE